MLIKFNDITHHVSGWISYLHITKGNDSAGMLPRQLNHQIALCWQEMPITFFRYFILIIIVESKYFKEYFLLVACSEAELWLIVITVRNDLLQNVPPILPRNIDEMVNSSNTSLPAFTRALDK